LHFLVALTLLCWSAAACVFLLQQIIEVNNGLRHGLDKGLPISSLMENWDFLQVRHAFCYFSFAGAADVACCCCCWLLLFLVASWQGLGVGLSWLKLLGALMMPLLLMAKPCL
jgi:hypothetical protein